MTDIAQVPGSEGSPTGPGTGATRYPSTASDGLLGPLAPLDPGATPAPDPARFVAARTALIDSRDLTAAVRRRSLSDLADRWLANLLARAVEGAPPTESLALVAVGGYGRRELLPGSDLDVVLVHDGLDRQRLAEVADAVFYPVWDSKVPLDHSVRTVAEARAVAREDLKATLGMLDARHIVGDQALTGALVEGVLGDWRRAAHKRLPALHAMVHERIDRVGELPYLLEPDLVEAYGGLRDGVVLRAVTASWLADYPHGSAVEEARSWLLTVRDVLHRVSGRRIDRLLMQEQDEVAAELGMLDADELLRRVSEAGRTVTYASDVAWRSVLATLADRSRMPRLRRRTQRSPLVDGVVAQDGVAVLARDVELSRDPTLPLRAAAAAAQAGFPMGVTTLEHLAGESPPLPEPWPRPAREAFVALLGAGRPAIPVLEALDAHGLLGQWIPEWDRVRFRPQRTPVHRHTVDRHSIQAAVEASTLARKVSRPDLLLVAALLHDLGKGFRGDHSEAGQPLAVAIATRMGFPAADAERIGLLVRHHLLLPEAATRRDLEDPATISLVAEAVGDLATLDLLAALTEADAVAAGPLAWTGWRAGLIRDLVARVRGVLSGRELPPATTELEPWVRTLAETGVPELVLAAPDLDGVAKVTVIAPDRLGLMAAVAGVLAVHRLEVRGARLDTVGLTAVQVWRVTSPHRSPPPDQTLKRDLLRALDGELDVSERLARRGRESRARAIAVPAPVVELLPAASATATVIEVRSHDEPGLLHLVASTVARRGVGIRSAVVGTLGAEAVDTLYLVDGRDAPLSSELSERVRHELAEALQSAHASGSTVSTSPA